MNIRFFLFFVIFACEHALPQALEALIDVDTSHLEREVQYTWGDDPFYKTPGYVKGSKSEEKLELKAILQSDDGRSLAVINNQTVFVNSVVDGWAVRGIGANFVVIEKGDSLRELQLPPIKNQVSSEIWDRLPAAAEPEKGAKDESH